VPTETVPISIHNCLRIQILRRPTGSPVAGV